MTDTTRAIFRADALERYVAGREKAVLPRFIAPPIFLLLWVALGLLTVGASIVLATQIRVYASGPDVVAPHGGAGWAGRDTVTVLVSVPPSALGQLRVGQSLVLTSEASGLRVAARMVAFNRAISSPATLRQRFALGPAAAQAITQPAAVLGVRLAPSQASGAAWEYKGSTFHADIRIGARRVVTLLPHVGPLFEEANR